MCSDGMKNGFLYVEYGAFDACGWQSRNQPDLPRPCSITWVHARDSALAVRHLH